MRPKAVSTVPAIPSSPESRARLTRAIRQLERLNREAVHDKAQIELIAGILADTARAGDMLERPALMAALTSDPGLLSELIRQIRIDLELQMLDRHQETAPSPASSGVSASVTAGLLDVLAPVTPEPRRHEPAETERESPRPQPFQPSDADRDAALEFVWSGERGRATDNPPPRSKNRPLLAALPILAALVLAGLLIALSL